MLQVIRDRFTGGFAIAILALIGVPFMFFGINYDFIGLGFAAKVNDREISISAFENAYRNALQQYMDQGIDIPPEFRSIIRENALDTLIRQSLLDQYVEDEGFRVNDSLVTAYIQRATEFIVDGEFSKETYYQWLELRALDPSQFEENQRIGLRLSQLQRGVGASAFVTPSAYRRYINLYGEQRQVSYAEIDTAALAETVVVTEEDVAAYYDARPDSFMSPEQVDLSYVEINYDDLGERTEISEEELLAFYKDSSSLYLQDERRQARHILILSSDDEAQAEEEAVALAARAKAGEPFEDLARQYSKDGGTAERGGDLGMLPKTQLPGTLGDTVFAMQEGDISDPIKSDFGFHIVRLDTIESGGSLPLQQVRAQLTDELRSRKALQIVDELMRNLSNALFDANDMQELADAVGLELKVDKGMTRAGGDTFGANQAMIDAVFDAGNLVDREISDIIELDASRSVVFQVNKYVAETRRTLAELSEEITAAIREEQASAMASAQASRLEAAILDGVAFASAAAEFDNMEVGEAFIGRQDTAVDPAIGAAVFGSRKPAPGTPTVGTVTTQSGNHAVYVVLAFAPGRPESIPLAERDAGKIRLGGQLGSADYAAMISEIESRTEIVKSEDALAQPSVFE